MSLSDFVTINITTVDPGVTQAGFGTVLILGYHTNWTDTLVREYSSLAGLATDGFASADGNGIYRAAAKLLAQNPRPTSFKVGRRTTGSTQKLKITPTAQNTSEYSFTVVTPAGVEHEVSVTSDGSATVAEIILLLETAVEAVTGSILTGTDSTTFLTVDAAAANTFYGFKDFSSNLTFEDITPDATLSTQLDAIALVDPDWYALISTSRGNPEILAIAGWVETAERFFLYSTNQTTGRTATTGNIGKSMKDLSYVRSFGRWSDAAYAYPEAGWAGRLLPLDPGSENWAFKTIAGDTVDSLTVTHVSNIEANNLNWYRTVAGKNITGMGVSAEGTFADIVRLRDWTKARMQEGIFGLLTSEDKVPFTDEGATAVQGEIESVIQEGQDNKAIATSPAPVVTVPLVADVSDQDKSDRHLPDCEFAFTITGAVNSVAVSGRVSV
jgi:hypothetical protein